MFLLATTAAVLSATMASIPSQPESPSPKTEFQRRLNDWRMGPVVYQVWVDRFAPPQDWASKQRFLKAPQKLMKWDEQPSDGVMLEDVGVYSNEIEFWGGDLPALRGRIDYIHQLGPDVLYLNPIHPSFSSHRYDVIDYKAIAPEYGTLADFKGLLSDVHARGMKLMMDGVFNHGSNRSKEFLDAKASPQSQFRDWYFFGSQFKQGYRSFAGVRTLPCWNLENPQVRKALWGPNGVVPYWLKQGIDGWRLDVAFEMGPNHLAELRRSARKARKDAAVVGEINGYPAGWFDGVDGVFNFYAMQVATDLATGKVDAPQAGRLIDAMIADAPYDNLLMSWLIADNHDVPRLASVVPNPKQRAMVMALLFTLPGSPVVYYGTELGMTGAGGFSTNRAPMRWDLVKDDNPDLALVRKLIALRKAHPALRVGDFKRLESDKLFAFARVGDDPRQAVFVVVNPTDQAITETLPLREGRIMSWGELRDAFSPAKVLAKVGMLPVTVPPQSVQIYTPHDDRSLGYSVYDRFGGGG